MSSVIFVGSIWRMALARLVRTAINESFVAGFRVVVLIAAGITLLGALTAALTIPPRAAMK